jgi:hypothetical protein
MNAQKRFFVSAALLLLAAIDAPAQPPFAPDRGHHFGAFVGPTLRIASIDRQMALLVGGATAIVVDRRIVFGLEGTVLCNNVAVYPETGLSASLRLLYGGIFVEYIIADELAIHPVLRATAGGGGVRTVDHIYPAIPLDLMVLMVDIPVDGPDDAFVLLEPGVGVEAVLGDNVRLELSGLFRIVTGIASPGLDNGLVGGASVALTAKVGVF